MNETELYDIYNKIVGKVRSGGKITAVDYGKSGMSFQPYPEDGKVAVTIAVDDVKAGAPTRSKSELVAEIRRRLS